jgi:lysophospholipase L1-like esterase
MGGVCGHFLSPPVAAIDRRGAIGHHTAVYRAPQEEMMKTMWFVTAAVLIAVGMSLRVFGADEAGAPGKPDTCVPAQKDPGRHEQFMKHKAELLRRGPIQLVFIGDSITDAWRGGEQNAIYKERWGKYNPLNLGISGDKTEHVLWRLENGELDGLKDGTQLVVMMIGTNNLGNPPTASPEDTAEGIKCLVKTVRQKLPESKLLLLGVFPRGKEPTDKFRAQIKTINDTISKLDDGKQVKYLDLSKVFLDEQGVLPSEVMPDQLHPSIRGYQIWADAMGPVIDKMIQ